jgi:hypothetical protein
MIVRPNKDLQDFEGRDWIYTYSKTYDNYFYKCVRDEGHELRLQGHDRYGGHKRDSFNYDKKEFYGKFVENPNPVDRKIIRLKGIISVLRELVDVSEIHNLLVEMDI